MNKRFGICILLLLIATTLFSTLLFAGPKKPELVIGPGLGTGRTAYHQSWNRTLDADTVYILTGLYYVDSTCAITIQPGTAVLGDTAATLIVKRGAQIHASGTPTEPIVFSSRKAPGTRARGDWGGVILLGDAPVNKVDPLIEGGIIEGTYGGNNPAHDVGEFCYARIEFGGYRYQLNNEVNGLTMGGVGSGSEIHHVQVSYNFDDMFEWFGGTVSCSCLVAFCGTDDEFDTDFGFVGNVQFCFGVRDSSLWDPTGESNGFESDNDGSSTSQDSPFTWCRFSNVTLVGPERTDALVGTIPPGHKFQYSAVLRRSTRHSIYNSVITGYPWGFSVRDPFTIRYAQNDTLQVLNTSVTASLRPAGSTSVHDEGRWAGVTAWFDRVAYGNVGSQPRNPSAVGLTNMSNLYDPNPVPLLGSELDGTASFADPNLAGFHPVTYRGAFEPGVPMANQWTGGWTNFDPKNTDYNPGEVGVPETPGGRCGELSQNAPNPFNPVTRIAYSVVQPGRVTLRVFDVTGRPVRTLVDGWTEAGRYETTWDGRDNHGTDVASGVYFYQIDAPGLVTSRKMVISK
jgi:hypothetical protein